MRLLNRVCMGLMTLSTGCGVDSSYAPTPSESEVTPSESLRDGLRYIPLRKNHPERFVPPAQRADQQAAASAEAAPDAAELASMSDEELVERMTGLTVKNGWIYRVVPEVSLVRSIKEQASGFAITPSIGNHEEPVDADPDIIPKHIIDGDNRQVRRSNTQYPWSTLVFMLTTAQDGACTGTMIGPSTLITAAHCFWDGQNFREYDFFPGADAADENAFPFGVLDCYGVVIAGTSVPDQDYAVVDFRSPHYGCSATPGNATGWMGVRAYDSAKLKSTTAHLYGYPGDKRPFPQIWGMGGRITRVESQYNVFDMDGTDGQSGAAVFMYEDSWPHVVGVYSGGTEYFGSLINYGPRITGAAINNIKAWSSDY